MSNNRNNGDWKEWSQHVLIEIQRLNDRQEKMSETLTENTKQLEIHIEGVKLAREQNAMVRVEMLERFKEVEEEIEPIRDQMKFINTTISLWTKLLGTFVGIPAMIYYCINIYMKLKGI